MFIKDLISETISPLSLDDSGQFALQSMDIYKVSHLPIVEHGQFMGLISDSEIFDQNGTQLPLRSYSLEYVKPYLFEYQHVFDAIELIGRLKLTLLPVLSVDKQFLGVVTLSDLVQSVSSLLAASTPGTVLELDVEPINYSMSEIARIVEDTNSKILSLYVAQRIAGVSLSIILKVDRSDASPVLQAFERYGYTVLNTFTQDGGVDEVAKKNYEALMRYLNI